MITKGPASGKTIVSTCLGSGFFWCLAVGFALFVGTLDYELVWDDFHLVKLVENAYASGGLSGLLTEQFRVGPGVGYFRPVVLASILIDAKLQGAGLWSFHATNLLLHLLACCLAFALFAKVLGRSGGAFWGALLFAVHPVHVESVVFMSGRTDLFAAVFVLGCLLAWLDYREKKRAASLAVASLCLLLAFLSKESALMLVALLPLWAFLFPAGGSGGFVKENRVWAAAFGAVVLLWIVYRFGIAGVPFGLGRAAVAKSHVFGATEDLGLFFRLWLNYMGLLSIPWPLNAFYLPSQVGLGALKVVGAIATLAVFVFASFRSKKALLGVLLTLAFLLPVSGLAPLPGAIMAERFLYLPSLGFCLAAGFAFDWFARRPGLKNAVKVVPVCLAALFFFISFARCEVWKNDKALYADMVKTSPMAPLAQMNYGLVLAKEKKYKEAEDYFRRAARLEEGFVDAMYNLAVALEFQGEYRESVGWLEKVVALSPANSRALYALIMGYARIGERQMIPGYYNELKRIDPVSAARLKTFGVVR